MNMCCSAPMVYVHISSRDKNKCQQTHCRAEFWETQLNQLAKTKSLVKFNPENDINVKLQIFNFTFLAITSISSMRICQQHQRIQFIYHSPFVFLGLLSSTVIFWTERSCWHNIASQCDLWHDIRHIMVFFFLSKMHWCRSFEFWE